MKRRTIFGTLLAGLATIGIAPARLAYEPKERALWRDVPVPKAAVKLHMNGGMERWKVSMDVAEAEGDMWQAGATAVTTTYRPATWAEKARGLAGVYEVRGTRRGIKPPFVRWGVACGT